MHNNLNFLFFILFFIPALSYAQEETENKRDVIADYADQEPAFVGGEEAMMKFIQENIIYPEKSVKKKEEGIVYAQFVVNKDGTLSNIKIMRGVCKRLDNAAMDVIKKMPNWIPGKIDGQKVRCRFTLPIHFRL